MSHAAQRCWQRPVPWDLVPALQHPLEVNWTHCNIQNSPEHKPIYFQLCSSALRWPQHTLQCATTGVDSLAVWWVLRQCACCPCGSKVQTLCMRFIPPIYPQSSPSIHVNWSSLPSPGKWMDKDVPSSYLIRHFLSVHSAVYWAPPLSGYIVTTCCSYVPARPWISFCKRSKCSVL